MSFVADVIGSAVSWVGEAVADVADFVVDDILMPVIDTVGSVVKGMVSDPFTTIASLAALATGQAWAIPLINGASTAAKGGSFGDVALAVAASYVGGEAGKYVGKAAGAAAYQATSGSGSSFATQAFIETAASNVASGATRGALTAALTGKDILDAGLTGALSGASASAFDYVTDSFDSLLDSEGNPKVSDGILSGETTSSAWSTASNTITTELSNIVAGFKELPQVAQDMIVSGATASVTSLVSTGELNADLIAGAIAKAGITTGLVKDAFSGGSLDDKQIAIATKVIGDVVQSAYSGTDGYAAYQASINQVGMGAIHAELDTLFAEGGINTLIESITTNSTEVDNSAVPMEAARKNLEIQTLWVNNKAEELETEVAKYKSDLAFYNNEARFGDQATADTLRASLEAQGENIKRNQEVLVSAVEEYEQLYEKYEGTAQTYKEASETLLVNQGELDDLSAPVTELASKLITQQLDSKFNPEEYREINKLSENEDPYVHWLETGRKNITNQTSYDEQLDSVVFAQISPQVINNFRDIEEVNKFVTAMKESIGNDMSVLQLPEGVEAIKLAADEYVSNLNTTSATNEPLQTTKEAGVTDADIATGKALAVFNRVGDKVGVTFSKVPTLGADVYDSRLNKYVKPIYNAETGQAVYLDPETFEPISGFTGGDIQPDGTVQFTSTENAFSTSHTIEYQNLSNLVPPNLIQLKEIAPVVAIDIAGNLKINNAAYAEMGSVGRFLVDFSTNVVKTAETYAVENPESAYAVKLAAGVALDSGGQLLSAFNGMVTFFENNKDNPIDARETDLGKATKAMMDIAIATNPEEYNTAITNFNKNVGDATGFAGTANAIWDGFKEAPAEVLIEFVGKELLQEIPLILASGGTGLIAKGAAGAATATAQFAQKFGTAAAWGTNAGLQVLETAGATAGETYAELYDEMVSLGVSPEQAAVKAQEGAILNGATAAIIEGTLGRVFDPGDVLAKKIAGANDTLFDTALKNIAGRGTGIAAEGVSEGIEETTSTYLKIAMLEKINPTITQKGGRYYDVAGTLTATGILAAVAGSGTAAGITVGDIVYDAVKNDTFVELEGGPTVEDYSPSTALVDTGNSVANLLKYFNPTVVNAVNDSKSNDPEVRTQGETVIKDAFGYDSFFEDDGSIIDLTENPNGVFTYNTAVDILNVANDNKYTSYQEAQDAYKDIAEQSPYTLTDQELLGFTGEQADADVGKRVTDTVNRGYVDQLFSEEGYTPTPEEISTALAQADEGVFGQDLGTALTTQFDPLAVTEQEVRDYYGDQGYTGSFRPTDFEVLTGQYAESELAEKADRQLPVIAYNSIADLIGKSGQDVTDTDIDFVTDLIAQQKVMTEPTPYTQQQLQYDVTGDNVIDIADQNVLQNMLTSQQTGQQVGPATAINTATQFASTGITGELERMRQQQQRNTQQQNVQQLYGSLSAQQQAKVSTPDPGKIDYVYNPFGDSIFANPKQEKAFVNPYSSRSDIAAARGGLIQDRTDEIMKILGGTK